ncbi:MAG: aminotransferase class III-fold pyridoxal phosphate-dependent enzyme, partial [Oscillospiraceae bacterium]|nr:aminotransferase class III-fold pyridoxal phosphate-dependent enzyme [Oscillospiraceae bacterium]
MDVFDRYESEVKSYCRAFPATFEKAKGVRLWDTDGNEYLDFFAGAGALNYGHNHDRIKEKVIEYIMGDNIMHGLDMHTVAKREFIDYFETNLLQPRGLDYKIQFTGPTGTNAVEAALKLARKYTGRSGIFAFMGAFHGMTLGSLALTTDASDRGGAG